MKVIIAILSLIFYSSIIFGQSTIYEGYFGQKQIGRLEVVKTDSTTYLRTDSSEIKIFKYNQNDSIKFSDRKENITYIKSINIDSLGILLFKYGFLTSDLLKKAYNSKRTKIISKNKKEDCTKYIDKIECRLYEISISKFKQRKLKKFLFFEITIEHLNWGKYANDKDSGIDYQWYSFASHFGLVLSAPIEGDANNLYEFISQAKFEYLIYYVTGLII